MYMFHTQEHVASPWPAARCNKHCPAIKQYANNRLQAASDTPAMIHLPQACLA
jgi:hypothetical protein